jgi:hypothetical protein
MRTDTFSSRHDHEEEQRAPRREVSFQSKVRDHQGPTELIAYQIEPREPGPKAVTRAGLRNVVTFIIRDEFAWLIGPTNAFKAAQEADPIDAFKAAQEADPIDAFKAAQEADPIDAFKAAQEADPIDAFKAA